MKALIRRFIGVLVEQHEKHNVATWSVSHFSPSSLQWRNLSPLDWTTIWRSVLLLSYDKYFCQVFGKEKILLESLAQRSNAAWIDRVSSCLDTCLHCGGSTAKHDISFGSPSTMFPPKNGFGSIPKSTPYYYLSDGFGPIPKNTPSFNSSNGFGSIPKNIPSFNPDNGFRFIPKTIPPLKNELSNVTRCNGCNIVYMEKLDLEQKACLSCPMGIVSKHRCDNASCGARYREVLDLKALVNPFYYNGKPFPVDPNPICKAIVHIDAPESLLSPKHFGHMTWMVCEFLASCEDTV
jgi:hypothetical protein